MDGFRVNPSLAESLQFGEQVVLVSESGGLHRAQQDAQNGHSWTFPADSEAFHGSSFPADALLVVLTGQDPKFIGFRSTFADGKLLAATKDKGAKLPHFEGHTFSLAEQWSVVGKSFHRCHVSNRKHPDKKLSVMIQRLGSGQMGRSSGSVSALDDSRAASTEFEDLSLSSPRLSATFTPDPGADPVKPKARLSALQYALGSLEYLKLGPPAAEEGSPVFLSPTNTPPASPPCLSTSGDSPHAATPQSKLREVVGEGEGGGEVEEGGGNKGVLLKGGSGSSWREGERRKGSLSSTNGEKSGGGSLSETVEKYVEKLEARVADLQSQVIKYSQAAREAEAEVGRKAEVVEEMEKKMSALASRQVTAGLAAMKASEEAEVEVEKMGAKLAETKVENAELVGREKEAVRKLNEAMEEREQIAERMKEKIQAAKAEGQTEAAMEYKERIREIKNEVEMHYANLLEVKVEKAREEIEKRSQQELEASMAAEKAKAEVGVNKAVEKRTAAMRAELIATSSKQVKERVAAARAEIEARVAKEVEHKVEVIRLANETSANEYAEQKVADMKKKLGEVMMEGDVRVQKAKEEAEGWARRGMEEVEKKAESRVAEVEARCVAKVSDLEAKLKMGVDREGRENGERDAAEIKQAAFSLAEEKVAQARAEFATKAEEAQRANAEEFEEKLAKVRSDIEAKEAKKVSKTLARLQELCKELKTLRRPDEEKESGEGMRTSEGEWKVRLAQAQVAVANLKAEEAARGVRSLEVVNETLVKRLKETEAKFGGTIASLEQQIKLLTQ